MTGSAASQPKSAVPGRPSADPRSLFAIIGVVAAITAGWAVLALLRLDGDARGWAVTALLAVLAVGYEEGARRASRLQIRLRTQIRADMTSVWILTAGIALSPGRCVVMLAALYVYMWFRHSRPAGELAHRKLYNGCSNLLAALSAGLAVRWLEPAVAGLPVALAGAVPVLVAVVVAIVVSRALITVALLAIAVRGRALLGTVHDNLIELSTPCLGALGALAVIHEPWLAVLVIVPMIALQRGALVRDLEAAAITDAKTGLLNAVAWEQLAQREIARAGRDSSQLGVLIIDIDRFKRVNDRFGHLAGDRVLVAVARAVEAAVREYDGVGRFGGEEFVVVLPDAGEVDALAVAERIRAQVNQMTITDVAGDFAAVAGALEDDRLSVSLGVALMRVDGLELTDLLHAADQALYRAKRNGRNQVQLARGGDDVLERISH